MSVTDLKQLLAKDHPLWRVLNTAVVLGGLGIILYVNAENFDITEHRTILEMVVFMAGWGGLKSAGKSVIGGESE